MSPVVIILDFLAYSTLAGILGALAMIGVMQIATRGLGVSSEMVIAVGSLLTKSRDNARLVGLFLHAISAIFFAMIYTLLIMALDCTGWPTAFFVGAGFGTFHGLVVSLSLCWVIADQHPLEEFREVSLPIALCHFVGHVAYGAMVGLVIALVPLSA
jgi:hypothetical protein